MNGCIFLFNLDGVITKEDIFPAVSAYLGTGGCYTNITSPSAQEGPSFQEELLHKVDMLKKFPVATISSLIERVKLNLSLVSFLRRNCDRCIIVTEYPDVWVEKLIGKLDMQGHVYCSKALTENGFIQDIVLILDKNTAACQTNIPYIAVGNRNNDAELIGGAEIGIGYGGVIEIAPSVLDTATYAIYDEGKLVDFLERLL